jgi:hypothetical protein
VGPRAGLDGAENIAPNRIRSPGRPARNESLHRLRYPGLSVIRVVAVLAIIIVIIIIIENACTKDR